MFKNILSKMDDMGGSFFGPSLSDLDFKKLIDSLRAQDIDLPDEYAEFLFSADGLYWGGIEFFASKIHSDKKRGFNITDLVSQNRLFQALNPDKTGCVLIGHSDEENYIYNSNTKEYEISEEFEENVLKSFNHFEDLLKYVIEEQIELVQNFVAFNEAEIRDEASDEDF